MNTNNSNGQNAPHNTRLNAIAFLWNQLKAYQHSILFESEEELMHDRKNIYNELDAIPEMFDVCTKLQKLEYVPAASPAYKRELVEIMMEAMEVLQTAPN